MKQTLDFYRTSVIEDKINDIMVTLIPKVSYLETVLQFRPIILCNVSYKVITKTMVNKIKFIIGDVVVPEQRSFVSDRQITDNIIIY